MKHNVIWAISKVIVGKIMIKAAIIQILQRNGFSRGLDWDARFQAELYNAEPEFRSIAEKFRTRDIFRQYAAWSAAKYVGQHNILGDVVECGVLHGKSAAILGHGLISIGNTDKRLWLYDTYSSDPARRPREDEFHRKTGKPFAPVWDETSKTDLATGSEEKTRANIVDTGFPLDRCNLVKGLVQKTIPSNIPAEISLLKIHTDFHDSVRHALDHLFSRIRPGGVLIVDAYGRYSGAKKATDEFFAENDVSMLLNRVDDSCRMGIKI